ncbi:hypothetical protein [Clostridium thermobutyricum]
MENYLKVLKSVLINIEKIEEQKKRKEIKKIYENNSLIVNTMTYIK